MYLVKDLITNQHTEVQRLSKCSVENITFGQTGNKIWSKIGQIDVLCLSWQLSIDGLQKIATSSSATLLRVSMVHLVFLVSSSLSFRPPSFQPDIPTQQNRTFVCVQITQITSLSRVCGQKEKPAYGSKIVLVSTSRQYIFKGESLLYQGFWTSGMNELYHLHYNLNVKHKLLKNLCLNQKFFKVLSDNQNKNHGAFPLLRKHVFQVSIL